MYLWESCIIGSKCMISVVFTIYSYSHKKFSHLSMKVKEYVFDLLNDGTFEV